MTRHTAVLEKASPEIEFIQQLEMQQPAGRHGTQSPFVSMTARLFSGAEPLKVMALTSCKCGEGVTHCTRHLADFLRASMGMRVCVLAGQEFEPVTAGQARILGIVEQKPPDVRQRMRACRNEHDAVLIDCGAMDSSSRLIQAAPHADGVVLVVEAGRTQKEQIARAALTIQAAQGKLLGIILNKRRYPVPGWLHRILG